MNPLDVSTQIPNQPDINLPEPPKGIPGLISADAIIQSYVSLLQQEVQKLNDFAWNAYLGLLSQWKSNNAAGINLPAPGPATLAAVDTNAAIHWETTGKNFSAQFVYYQKWDPNTPPGTIAAKPAPPEPPAKSAESVGALIPGTSNLYAALGGPYDPSECGKPNGEYTLINMTPFGWEPAWRKG